MNQLLKQKPGRRALSVLLAAALLLTTLVTLNFAPLTVSAAPIVPTLVVKNGDDSSTDSLRDVLANAKDGDTITFDPAVTTVTLTTAQLTITQKSLTIDGGAGVTIKHSTAGPTPEFRLLYSNVDRSALTFRGLTFENGQLTGDNGGGLCIQNSKTLTLQNCTFAGNQTDFEGGGLFAEDCGNVALTNCTFTGNSADLYGGGLFAKFCNVTALSGCVFAGNSAVNGGGGCAILRGNGSAVTDCTFIGNNGGSDGGAIYNAFAPLSLTGCVFTKNTVGGSGGAVFSEEGDVTALNCGFDSNESVFRGGAVCLNSSGDTLDMTNCSFFKNKVAYDNGIVYSDTVNMRHCTFTNNFTAIASAYLICANGVNAQNCLITQDGFANISNQPISAAENALDATYAVGFEGENIMTFGYIMPSNQIISEITAPPAQVLPGYETDAAGNTRTVGNCQYGAVEWFAVSHVVKNESDDMTNADSLRKIFYQNWVVSGPLKLVVYFADAVDGTARTNFNIQAATELTTSCNQDIFIIGRLGIDGKPEITIDGGGNNRVFSHTKTSTLYFYGLNIKNGYTSYNGGGIYSASGSVYAHSVVFEDNTARLGGGVYAFSTLTLNGCTFAKNQATNNGKGGGAYAADVTAENCVFTDNEAAGNSRGGGLYSDNTAALTGCAFIGNKSESNGGGLYVRGNAELTDCSFTGNKANNSGGTSINGDAALTGCVFTGNAAAFNSGGANINGTAELADCVFTDNSADLGGALIAISSLLIMTDCTVSGNTTYNTADCAIHGVMKSYLFHCTVTNNKGGGIYAESGKAAALYNSIVTGNTNAAGTAPLQTGGSGTITSVSSLIEGQPIPGSSPAVNASHAQVFGLNAFDGATHKVLSNGIAAGKAAAVADTAIDALTDLTTAQQTAVKAALAKDQTGAARSRTGAVTYGAVEAGANSLTGISVVSGSTTKTSYVAGDTLNLAGTLLNFTYSNGTKSNVAYNESGITNNLSSLSTATVGTKTVNFTCLGVTTATGLDFTVNKASGAAVSAPTLASKTATGVTLNAVTAPATGQGVEYAHSTANTAPTAGWQSGLTFTGLAEYTEYYFFARSVGNTNYETGAASGGTAIRTADVTAPTATVQYKQNGFKSFVNTVSFGLFFKKNVDVEIKAADTGSGVASVDYYKAASSVSDPAAITGWTTGTSFSVTQNEKFILYVRVTDNDGNSVIYSDGVVVYTDSAADTQTIAFTKTSTDDVTANVTLNGNTIDQIKNGAYTLASGTDYTVSGGTITFKYGYLDTLTNGTYSLTVSYKPLGESYISGGDNEAPATTSITLTVGKAGQSIAITGLGSSYTYGDAAFGLSTSGGLGTGSVTYSIEEGTGVVSVSGNTVTVLKAGTFKIRATKAADSNYAEASVVSNPVTVSEATPTVTVTGADVSYGSNVTLNITVSGAGATPTGTVTIKEGATVLASNIALTNGAASYTITAPNAGTHNYTAEYSGQTDYYTAATDTKEIGVGKTNQAGFAVTVPGAKTYGDAAFTLTATGGQSTGGVTFSVPNDDVVSVTASGAVTIRNAGTVTVTASKAGDDNYNAYTATVTITVNPRDISGVSVTVTGSTVYTGSQLQPAFTVSDGTLAIDTGDYTNSYGANVNVGKGTVTLTGQRNYTGTKTVEFEIVNSPSMDDVIDAINNLPNPVKTKADADKVAEVTNDFNNLTDEEKNEIPADIKQKLEDAQDAAGEINIKDGEVALAAPTLPWYVRLEATPIPSDDSRYSDFLGKLTDKKLLVLYDIKLINTLTGAAYELPAGKTVTVELGGVTLNGADIAVVHEKGGAVEAITATVKDGKISFAASGFSLYGVTAMADKPSPVPQTGDNSNIMLWLLLGGASLTLGGLTLIGGRRRKFRLVRKGK